MVFSYSAAPTSSLSPARESSVLEFRVLLGLLTPDLVIVGPKEEGCTQEQHLGHRCAWETELPLLSTMKQVCLSELCLRSTRAGREAMFGQFGSARRSSFGSPRQGHDIPESQRGLERFTDFYEVSAHTDLKFSRGVCVRACEKA